jgi:hypothetical protein
MNKASIATASIVLAALSGNVAPPLGGRRDRDCGGLVARARLRQKSARPPAA